MMHDHRPNQWLHAHDCRCETCQPQHPSEPDRLTAPYFAMLAVGGFAGGAGISILYDPPAALTALAAIVGVNL